jgi:hypothetical protein
MAALATQGKKTLRVARLSLLVVFGLLGLVGPILAGRAMLQSIKMSRGLKRAEPVAATISEKKIEEQYHGKDKQNHYFLYLTIEENEDEDGPAKRVETGSKTYNKFAVGDSLQAIADPLGHYEWVIMGDSWHESRPATLFLGGLSFLLVSGWVAGLCLFGPLSKMPWSLPPDQPAKLFWFQAGITVFAVLLLFMAPYARMGAPSGGLGVVLMALLAGGALAGLAYAWVNGPATVEGFVRDRSAAKTPLSSVQAPPKGATADPDSPFRPIRTSPFYASLFMATLPAYCAIVAMTLQLGVLLAGAMLLASAAAFFRTSQGVGALRDALNKAWSVVDASKPSQARTLEGTWRGILFDGPLHFVASVESSSGNALQGSIIFFTHQDENNEENATPMPLAAVYDPELGEFMFDAYVDPVGANFPFWGLVIGPHSIEGFWMAGQTPGTFLMRREAASNAG